MIHEIAAIRLERTLTLGRFTSRDQVLAVAALHLEGLARFDPDLSEELLGIADGADIDTARVVVLNHYTDLRDIDPATVLANAPVKRLDPSAEEDCSAIYARTPEGPLLGQTWDMHGSALPYVMMLKVPSAEDVPACWVLTITGCLGMAGLNDAGVGITINNLKSLDARVGVVWPALVRRALKQTSAESSRDVVMDGELGSGHHYMVADAERAFGIETSGTRERIVYRGEPPGFLHTNHCLDAEMAALHTVGTDSTTHDRFDALSASLARSPIRDRGDLWRRLGSHDGYPRSVCSHIASPHRPHGMRTCGALVMSLATPDLWAAHGCVHHARAHVFGF
jgi:isopenicillin-N N-acyltransferase-like protein